KAARVLKKHRFFKYIPERLMDGVNDVLVLAARVFAAGHGQEQMVRLAMNDFETFDHEHVIEGHAGKRLQAWIIYQQDPDVGDRHPRSPLWPQIQRERTHK